MLYFVATPIGNLKDISYRAIEVLKSVDVIFCEDTRHSLTLLNHYEIKKPLFSYHKYNEKEVGEKIIDRLRAGENIAIISDAGMPVISDPGSVLISMLKEFDLEYTVIPGASASLSALILSGLKSDRFCFIGFLPEKEKDRKKVLTDFMDVPATLIFYCAPHDVKRDVAYLYKVLGDRKASAVKEITKIHERAITFNLKDGIGEEPRGEYVILVSGKEKDKENIDLTDEQLIDLYISEGMDKKTAVKTVAKERGIAKSELYKFTIGK